MPRIALTLIGTFVLGQYLGWFVSAFVLSRPGFASGPYINAVAHAATSLVLCTVLARRLLGSGRIPSRISYGVFGAFYTGLAVVTTMSLLIGVLRDSPWLALAADTTYFANAILAYVVVVTSKRNDIAGWHHVFRWLVPLALVFAAFGRGPTAAVVTLFLVAAALNVHSQKYLRALWYLLPLVATLTALNRSALVQVTLLMLLLLALVRPRRRMLLPIGVAGVLVMFAAFLGGDILRPDSPLARRIERTQTLVETGDITREQSLYQRIFEAAIALEDLAAGGPVKLIGGAGAGATLNMAESEDAAVQNAALLGERQVHNIHLLPFAVLYRHGIMGVMIFALYPLAIIVALAHLGRLPEFAPYSVISLAGLYLVLNFTDSLIASTHLLANVITPVFAAILDRRLRSRPERFQGMEEASPLPQP